MSATQAAKSGHLPKGKISTPFSINNHDLTLRLKIKSVVNVSQQVLIIKPGMNILIYLRKERISVALSRDLIAKIDEESKRARRSRSDLVQLILENYFKAEGEVEVAEARRPIPSLRRAF